MNDKMKPLQLKKLDHDYPVVLTHDKCKSGESQYGAWNLYGVEYEGVTQGIFAEDALHLKLMKYGKGAHLILCRHQHDNGELEWQVTPANGSNKASSQTVLKNLDDRTADIHRQVALKIATISIGQSTKPWTNEDLQEIKLRMDKLLEILDERANNDLPF
jgi:hypothetical protein